MISHKIIYCISLFYSLNYYPMPILSLQNISKNYGALQALSDVSFSVPAGSVFGILGPNGSGKTTLLGIVTDVLKADKGSFQLFDKTPTAKERQQIGTLLETPNFYHYLSAYKNLVITSFTGPEINSFPVCRIAT